MSLSDNFINEFKEFNELISANPILGDTWGEFRKTLVFPTATEKASPIYKTEEAIEYFNEETVIAGTINLRFYSAFPNYLTGAGILGTFVGLVAGIYLAGAGLASDDTQLLKDSLRALLNGASLAFWTSIVGLVCSILFSWREKVLIHASLLLVDEWNIELNKRIAKIKPEILAQKQLYHLKKQTEYLEEFSTKVAFNIVEALDTRLNQKLLPALDTRLNERLFPCLEKLIDSIDSMRRERGDTNERLIEQMIDKFSHTMTGAAGSEMTAMSNTLNSLSGILIPLLQDIKDAQTSLDGAASHIAQQIQSSYDQSGKAFSNQIEAVLSELTSGVAQAGNLLNTELREAFQGAVTHLDLVVAKLDESIESIGDAGRRSSENFCDGVNTAINQLSSGIANMGDSLNSEMKEAYDKAVNRLDDIVTELDTSIGSLGIAEKNAEQLTVKTTLLLEQFASMAKDIGTIHTKMQPSLQSIEKAASSIENAGNAARQNLTLSVKALEDFRAAAEEFSRVQEDLKQVWNNYSVRFKDVDISLEKIFSQMNDGLDAYAEATSKYMGELDKHAKEVTEYFSGAVKDFSETVDDLREAISREPSRSNPTGIRR